MPASANRRSHGSSSALPSKLASPGAVAGEAEANVLGVHPQRRPKVPGARRGHVAGDHLLGQPGQHRRLLCRGSVPRNLARAGRRGGRVSRSYALGGWTDSIYGTVYGVKRTTIYLTETQKQELEAIAARTQQTEAQLIREGVDQVIALRGSRRRKPGALFALDDPALDDPHRVDEALEGFGGE